MVPRRNSIGTWPWWSKWLKSGWSRSNRASSALRKCSAIISESSADFSFSSLNVESSTFSKEMLYFAHEQLVWEPTRHCKHYKWLIELVNSALVVGHGYFYKVVLKGISDLFLRCNAIHYSMQIRFACTIKTLPQFREGGLKTGIWTSRLGYGHRGWDMGLGVGGVRRRRRRRRRRKFPCVKA